MYILVLNGPNLNFLGIREPEIYGKLTYKHLETLINTYCIRKNINVKILQTNSEGTLVDFIQEAYFESVDGIVINPAGYTHTSVAILDAIKSVNIPTVEVHISDVDNREEFRKVSYIREACIGVVSGKGFDGYIEAIEMLVNKLKK